MQLVIVTGMSGAGKSRVIDTLEDIGFFCVDNMTPKLMPTFVQLLEDSAETREKVAIAADIRLGGSFLHLFNALEELKKMDCEYKILFIDAENDVIIRRYQETRRKHPLSNDNSAQELQDIISKDFIVDNRKEKESWKCSQQLKCGSRAVVVEILKMTMVDVLE